MALTSSDETDLLTALYEGAFDEPLWATFLERLRMRVQADHASLLLRGGMGGTGEITEFHAGRPAPQAMEPGHVLRAYGRDPARYDRLRPGRIYAAADLGAPSPSPALPAPDPAARPGAARLVRVDEPGGGDACLVVAREGEEDFTASTGALLIALAPHLRIALRGFMAMQRERLRASLSGEVIQRLNFGWFMLDASGHVIDLDDQAERLLQRSPVLRRTRQGRLLPQRRDADRALSEVLRAIRAYDAGRPRLIHLSDEPWLDMLVLPVADDAASLHQPPALAVYIQGDQRGGTQRREQLMALFDLSANEAHLALALSRGATIAEAATELGLTLESARTYSKRIYAKTSTRGQTDLVRLILASVIALA